MNIVAALTDLPPPVLYTCDERRARCPVLNRRATFNVLGEDMLAAVASKLRKAAAMDTAFFCRQREPADEDACQLTGQTIARNIMQPLSQEDVQAFIGKRKPQWPALAS